MPQAIDRLFATPMIKPRFPAKMPGAVVCAISHLNNRWSDLKDGFFSRPGRQGEGLRALRPRESAN
jgi:hypothetical protein